MTIDEVVALQRKHAPVFAKRPIAYRKAKLKALRSALKGPWQQRLVDAMKADFNKGDLEVRLTEILPTLDNLKLVTTNINKWTRPQREKTPLILTGSTSYTQVQPKGSVLILSPWNYPIFLTLHPLINAIAAGNTVILKPSEHTSHTSQVMADMIAELFKPEEVHVILGGIQESQQLLAKRWDHIFFTGSTQVGQIVMEAASKHLTPVTLELGGKSPTIIDSTANAYSAGWRIAWAKFTNAGQTCIAPDHIYVHEGKLEDFNKGMVEAVIKYYGHQPMDSEDYPQVINMGHWNRLVSMLEEAKSEGGDCILGGNASKELRKIEPTVVVNPQKEGALMREEIFGPLLPVFTFTELEEPLKEIASREHPLVVYIYSNNKRNIRRIQNETRAGTTSVNMSLIHIANNYLPFGGIGHSGMGKTNGKFGFLEFSNQRASYYQWGLPVNRILAAPFTAKKLRLVKFLIRRMF